MIINSILNELKLHHDRTTWPLIISLRLTQRLAKIVLIGRVLRITHKLIQFLYRVDIPWSASIGPNLTIHHPYCIVIHPNSVIGANCTLRHGVTIGNDGRTDAAPTIGDNVSFGCFASVFGNTNIASNTRLPAFSITVSRQI